MTRLYAYREKETNSWVLKEKRRHVAFRGTIRYCSIGMHERQDQGRVDDLWGWLYMCVEMRRPLPWKNFSHPDKVHHEKKNTSVAQLLGQEKILTDWKPIVELLQATDYYDRPAYEQIVAVLRKQLKERKASLLDDYSWEDRKDCADEQTTTTKLRAACQKYGRQMPKKAETGPVPEAKLWEMILKAAQDENIPGGGERHETTKGGSGEQNRSRSCVMPVVKANSKPPTKKKQTKDQNKLL